MSEWVIRITADEVIKLWSLSYNPALFIVNFNIFSFYYCLFFHYWLWQRFDQCDAFVSPNTWLKRLHCCSSLLEVWPALCIPSSPIILSIIFFTYKWWIVNSKYWVLVTISNEKETTKKDNNKKKNIKIDNKQGGVVTETS